MIKTIYHISQMDCPSEEALIRMKLESLNIIKSLEFDLDSRNLTIFHTTEDPEILTRLEELKLGTTNVGSTEVETSAIHKESNHSKLLWSVLLINFGFFIIELTTGLISKSMGLVADSLDMLADSVVYGLSLWAVGAALARKKLVARLSGYFQIILALLGLTEVVRRYIFSNVIPNYQIMIIVASLALIANVASMYILQKTKSKDAHIRASKIFTSNDIIINFGIIGAALLVMATQSMIPDLVIGAIVFFIVMRGAIRILKLGK